MSSYTIFSQQVIQCGSDVFGGTRTLSLDGAGKRDVVVPAGESDVRMNIDIRVAQVKIIHLLANGDLALKINSAGNPVLLTLLAGVPYVWVWDQYLVNLFTTDVTALFLSNDDTENDVTLAAFVAEDSTP